MRALSPVDKFGKFIVENLRDKGIDFAEALLNGRNKAPALFKIQNEMGLLSDIQKATVASAIIEVIDSAMHDFLFALQEQADVKNNIQILVDGQNIIELSDGLHGEAYSDDGWFARYSKHNANI